MSRLDLATAQIIVAEAIGYARRAGIEPLTVVVLDDRAAVKAAGADDGIKHRTLRDRARQGRRMPRLRLRRARAAEAAAGFSDSRRPASRRHRSCPFPGGVLIRGADRAILGAVGISGDTGERDEEAAVAASRRVAGT